MSSETELRALERIEREGQVARMQVPGTVRSSSDYSLLLQTEILKEIRRGAGRVVTVKDAEAFTRYLDSKYPGRAAEQEVCAIANVHRYRSSKAGRKQAFGVVLLRGEGTVKWNGHAHDLGRATERIGCSACLRPRLRAERICIVENLDTFTQAESLLGNWTFVHPYGRIGTDTFAGLEADELLHFGDYDFTGLADFLRLRARFPNVRLYLPDALEELWSRYARPLKDKGHGPGGGTAVRTAGGDPGTAPAGGYGKLLEQQALFAGKDGPA